MSSGATNNLHAAATRIATRQWRADHPEEWKELWSLLQGIIRQREPEADATRLWDLTNTAMKSNIAESSPQEWKRYREEALAKLRVDSGQTRAERASAGWTDQRRQEQSERMRSLSRVGGRWSAPTASSGDQEQ